MQDAKATSFMLCCLYFTEEVRGFHHRAHSRVVCVSVCVHVQVFVQVPMYVHVSMCMDICLCAFASVYAYIVCT